MVNCEICGVPTPMAGTKRCDSCWELERRIGARPAAAREILRRVDSASFELLPLPNPMDGVTAVIRVSTSEGRRKVVMDSIPTHDEGKLEAVIVKSVGKFCAEVRKLVGRAKGKK